MIQRVRDALSSIFERLLIVGADREKYAFLEISTHRDIVPEMGALGGIYTGLASMPDEWGFIVACDMPFINEKLVRAMFEMRSGYDVVAPQIDGFYEPLHAFYHRRCLDSVRKVLDSGSRQIILTYKDLKVKRVDEQTIRGMDPEMKSFVNINTPGDLPDNNAVGSTPACNRWKSDTDND